jgi:hypothetical protein
MYCDLFNDLPGGVLSEKYGIKSLGFGDLIDYFFWDIDFLNDNLSTLSMEARQDLAVSPETFGLSMGMKPHPEELALQLCDPDDDTEAGKAYVPGSKTYPDFSNTHP